MSVLPVWCQDEILSIWQSFAVKSCLQYNREDSDWFKALSGRV